MAHGENTKFELPLSRKDQANVSYFTGTVNGNIQQSWIEDCLLPAISNIAIQRGQRIRNTPITFWICVRETARSPTGEIFLFSTPWRATKKIDETVRTALSRQFPQDKIFQGIETIPKEAVPCCQSFRGKLLRFYSEAGGEGFYSKAAISKGRYLLPTIRWYEQRRPYISLVEMDPMLIFCKNGQDSQEVYVCAAQEESLDGDSCRDWQQGLVSLARITEEVAKNQGNKGVITRRSDSNFSPDAAREMLANDKSYFTVREMTELLSTLADDKISKEITNQLCKDVMTYPYYDSLAMWIESEQWWAFDNRLYSILAWLLDRDRYSDRPALVKTRGFGKRFREVMKLNRIPKSTEKMIVARASLDEALWRRQNPDADTKELRSLLLDQITKLESTSNTVRPDKMRERP